MLLSEKITLTVSLWTIVTLLITADTDLSIFIILIVIGLIINREVIEIFTPSNTKERMDIFIYAGIILFIIIISYKILTVLKLI